MSRLLILGLAVVALGSCRSAQPPPADDAPLRVMSFNLRLNVASDSANAWPHRRDAVARILDGADLVGVQEALPGMLEDLDERLPGYDRLGVGRQADGGGEYSAVLYRTDRLEPLDSGTFWLSETPEVAGSQSWDAALPRIATWGRFRDRATDAVLVHVNTHFDHVGVVARQQSARLLVRRLGALADGAPVVLTGDFNVTPDSEVYQILTGDTGLVDAWASSETPASGPAATWNDFGRAPLDRRIDFVFTRGPARVLQFRTVDDTIGDVMGTDNEGELSDHYAVEATVRIGPR